MHVFFFFFLSMCLPLFPGMLFEALFSLSVTTDDFFFIKLGKPLRVGWRFQYYATGLNKINVARYVAKRNGLFQLNLANCCVCVALFCCHRAVMTAVSVMFRDSIRGWYLVFGDGIRRMVLVAHGIRDIIRRTYEHNVARNVASYRVSS